MSQELQRLEEASRRKAAKTLACLDGGLAAAVARSGGELVSYSVRERDGDCLLTLRINMPAGAFIAFVGSETVSGAVIKATNDANSDSLKLKRDQYAKRGED